MLAVRAGDGMTRGCESANWNGAAFWMRPLVA
jgi:hypothetical protein